MFAINQLLSELNLWQIFFFQTSKEEKVWLVRGFYVTTVAEFPVSQHCLLAVHLNTTVRRTCVNKVHGDKLDLYCPSLEETVMQPFYSIAVL